MDLSPVILTVYNRPEHTKRTVEALKANTLASNSILYVFSDASKDNEDVKDVNEVRRYIHSIKGFKEVYITEREEHFGLARNIISCATEVINKYGKVILVEDDLVSSPYFLKYMNDGLDRYKDNLIVGSISGFTFSKNAMQLPKSYNHDIFFFVRPSSWGWATWKDKWNQVDWDIKDYNEFKKNPFKKQKFNKGGADLTGMLIAQMKGKINSWAVRWSYNFYKKGWLSVYPTISFIDNQGHDNSGIHSKASNKELYKNYELNQNPNIKFIDKPFLDNEICKKFRNMYARNLKYYSRKILYKLKITK